MQTAAVLQQFVLLKARLGRAFKLIIHQENVYMKIKEAKVESTTQTKSSTSKAIDYLQRQFPWKTREVIVKAFNEAGANLNRVTRLLSGKSFQNNDSHTGLAS